MNETPARIQLNTLLYGIENNPNHIELLDFVIKQELTEQEARHQEVLEEIANKIDRLGRKTVEYFSPTRSISQGIVKSLSDAASIVRSYKK